MTDIASTDDKKFFNDGRLLSGTSGRWLLALPLAFALPFLVPAGFAPPEQVQAPQPPPEAAARPTPARAVSPAACADAAKGCLVVGGEKLEKPLPAGR